MSIRRINPDLRKLIENLDQFEYLLVVRTELQNKNSSVNTKAICVL